MDTILETRDSIRFTRLNKRARRAQVTLEVNLPDGCTEAQAKAYLNAALALDKRVSAPVDLPIDPMGFPIPHIAKSVTLLAGESMGYANGVWTQYTAGGIQKVSNDVGQADVQVFNGTGGTWTKPTA